VRVTVQRRGLPDASHLYRWTVGGGASPTRTAVVSTAPIGFFLATSAAVLAAMAAAAWLVAWALRAGRAARRRREVETEDVTAEVMHPDDAVVGAVGQSASA
jgi:hypothetical protein